MDEFTDAVIYAVGGWDPRFDRVVAKVVIGTEAMAIIEANGVDSEITDENIERFSWILGRWQSLVSGSCGDSGWCDGMAYACGNGRAGETVIVEFDRKQYPVEVAQSGFWLFAPMSDYREYLPRHVD